MNHDDTIKFDLTIPANTPLCHDLKAYEGDRSDQPLDLVTRGYALSATYVAVIPIMVLRSKIKIPRVRKMHSRFWLHCSLN